MTIDSTVQGGVPSGLPRVIVLATGGTIAGRADERSAHGYNAGGVPGEQLVANVPGLDRLVALRVEQIANVASQDISEAVWLALAARIRRAIDCAEADGIVITHGTDTLEETAFFLHNVLPVKEPLNRSARAGTPGFGMGCEAQSTAIPSGIASICNEAGRPKSGCVSRAGLVQRFLNLPVVLTGSMRPGDAPDADGPANLRAAVRVAASPLSPGRGVLVAMGGAIHDARRVVKAHTTALDALQSPEGGPIGTADAAGVRYFAPAPTARGALFAVPLAAPLPRVAIVYAHAGMDAAPIVHAVRDGARGIVLAGLGNGNAPQAVLVALAHAARQGVTVVRATRVPLGAVSRNVEIDDDRHGFIAAGGLNSQKARVLLQLLIASGVTVPDAMQRAFDDAAQGC